MEWLSRYTESTLKRAGTVVIMVCVCMCVWLSLQNACEELMRRLEPFMKEDPAAGWYSWVSMYSILSLYNKAHNKLFKVFDCHNIQHAGK